MNRIAVAFADRSILFVDSHGPHAVVATEFFETERRMGRILGEQLVSSSGRLAHFRVER